METFRVYYVDGHGKGSSIVRAEDADAAQLHMMYAHPERDVKFALQPAR